MADWATLECRDKGRRGVVAGDDAHGDKVAYLSNLDADGDGTAENSHVDDANRHLGTAGADLEQDLVHPEDLSKASVIAMTGHNP